MKERVISAVIALLICVPLLLLGGVYFDVLVVVIGLLGLKEMLDLKKDIPSVVKYITYALFLLILLFGYMYVKNVIILNYTLILICFFILLISLLVYRNKKYDIEDVFYLIGSIIFLSSAFYMFVAVRRISLMLLIYLLSITIVTDTFAYVIGSKYGKHKLMKDVSPNKSIEGFIGGLIFGSVFACLFYVFCVDNSNILYTIVLTILLSILGQVGDLVFSSIKRHFNIKDFSNIMPGHGGVLDRLDSIIFVLFGYIIFSVII